MAPVYYEANPEKYFADAGVDGKIKFNPDAKPGELAFRFYDPNKVVGGKSMQDWLRFSVVYWHTFRGNGSDPFGGPTLNRPWENGSDSLDNAKRRLRVAFHFMHILGVKFYTFHDRDIAPTGKDLEETNRNLDELTDLALVLQKEYEINPLWVTCNLFTDPRYMNGSASNPDVHVLAYAAAQVKKGLDTAKKLVAVNFIFWGGREGFHTLLNTDLKAEMSHMAKFFHMAVKYKEKIGFKGQLCIEPKPKEPTKHQYDYDAMTVIAFLRTYGLDKHFKLNIEPNHTTMAGHDYVHDVAMASALGMLGSIDANSGSPDLGWDTDQFPMDVKHCTQLMKVVVDQGGLSPGGLNFDCKVRRESTDVRDMFIAHVGAMDCLARGLVNAVKIMEEGSLDKMVKERYSSYESSEIGKKLEGGSLTLEECQAFIVANGEPKSTSGRQEHYEAIFNNFL